MHIFFRPISILFLMQHEITVFKSQKNYSTSVSGQILISRHIIDNAFGQIDFFILDI